MYIYLNVLDEKSLNNGKINIIGMDRFPPIILFSSSDKIGAAGICSSNDVICIAIDFPLWFILLVFLHEMGHYLLNNIPLHPDHKNFLTQILEDKSHRFMMILPPKYREKTIINQAQIIRYITWECSVFGNSDIIDVKIQPKF